MDKTVRVYTSLPIHQVCNLKDMEVRYYCTEQRANNLIRKGRAEWNDTGGINLVAKRTFDKKVIWNMAQHRCYICNTPLRLEEMTIDHVIPKTRASSIKHPLNINNIENQYCCCGRCNFDKNNMTAVEYAEYIKSNIRSYPYIPKDRIKKISKIGYEVQKRLKWRNS